MHTNGATETDLVSVISPDRPSGKEFTAQVNTQLINGATEFPFAFSARVHDDEITPKVAAVSRELAAAIAEVVRCGHKIITISCNTLSLNLFMQPALEILQSEHHISLDGLTFVLTIQEIRTYVENSPGKRTLVLGTKPLSKILAGDKTIAFNGAPLPTLTNADYINQEEKEIYLNLVQAIIWRVKARTNSDISTAPPHIVDVYNEEPFNATLLQLNDFLVQNKIDTVIMGCTELPIAFAHLQSILPQEIQYELIDPATLVGQAIKNRRSQPGQ